MKKHNYIYFTLSALILVASCSRTKDSAMNRGFHSMNTKYNILYNGNLALDQGLRELNSQYIDDYWERLPIEPLKIDELAMPGASGNTNNSNASFEVAEEKAVKAVQKHSMNIKGRERNSQIDNAYLLLGKSRYYSQRFVQALEAFNYVIKTYPTADLITETRIWRAKTLLRLNVEEMALQSLSLTLNKEEMHEEEVLEQAHTAMAMVYTVMDSTSQVIYHLKRATETNNYLEQKARNLFILGQIYSEQNEIDSARMVFSQIIEMKKIPYKYQIHSEIELAKNISDNTDVLALNSRLTKLINTRENRPYLDELFYQSALVFMDQGQYAVAEQNFKKSIHAIGAKQFQKSLSHEKLGDLYFDKANFIAAGAHYDSVMQIPQNKNTKRFRKLERKRDNLDGVILFEGIAHETDSIINVVLMTPQEREIFFQDHIDKLLAAKKLEEELAENRNNSGFGEFDTSNNGFSGGGKWYFYNTQLSRTGQQKFTQAWGNRPLENNWRISDRTSLRPGQLETNAPTTVIIAESEKYSIETYMDLIPTRQSHIDSIYSKRDDAYYNLGLIYKEQLNEFEIAAQRFESLLTFDPSERFVLPTKYHLYKIYLKLNPERSKLYENDIVTNYPESKYALIISNPADAIALADNEVTPENVYEDVYREYQDKLYTDVIVQTEKAIVIYEDLPILPKFELLRAYAIGKTQGEEAFMSALEFVALNYSNTVEGKKAEEVIATINK